MKFDELKKEIQGFEFSDLVDLYLEAKTGNDNAIDMLPAEIVETISALDKALKDFIE